MANLDRYSECSNCASPESGASAKHFDGSTAEPDAPSTPVDAFVPQGEVDAQSSEDSPVETMDVASSNATEPNVEASREAAPDASGDAPPVEDAEAEAEADARSSCGPTTTAQNCGACGVACDTAHSQAAACSGGACTYGSCSAGWSDCDKTAPNSNGCECNTPACCTGGACQIAHSNGTGQTFYDCSPAGMYTQALAMEACAAFTGSTSKCAEGPTGICGTTRGVCSTGASSCWCWQYAGSATGTVEQVQGAICPSACPSGLGTAWK